MNRNLLIPVGLFALVFFAWRGAFGGEPFVSVLPHAINVVALWLIVRLLAGSVAVFEATAAAALFAVHPSLAEAVIEAGTKGPIVFLMVALALMLVGTMTVMQVVTDEEREVHRRRLLACVILVSALAGSTLTQLLTAPVEWKPLAAYGVVGELLVMPWRCSAYRDPPGPSAVVHGVLLLLLTLPCAVWALALPARARLASLGGLWMLAALLPLAGHESGMDEHAIVVVAGFAVFLSGLLGYLHRRRAAAGWGGLLFLVVLGVLGIGPQVERWTSPETVLRDAIVRAPGSQAARDELARLLERRASSTAPADSVALLEEALSLRGDGPGNAHARGTILIRLGRFQEGLRELESDGKGPHGAYDITTRSSALIAVGRLDEARALLADGTERWPESVDLRNLDATAAVIAARLDLAGATTDEGKRAARTACEEGIARYQAILDEHPDHFKTRCDHAKAVIGADWLPDHPILTTKLVNELVRDFPREGYVKYLRGRVLADADTDEAIRILDEAIVLDPLREEPYELLSHLLIGRGRTKEAKLVLDKGLETIPGSPRLEARMAELMIALARHHQSSGAPDLASRAAERAAELAPHAVEPWLVIGEMHLERAQMPDVETEERDTSWERARRAYDRALEIDGENVAARDGLAQYFRARGYGVLLTMKAATRGLDGEELKARRLELRRRAMFDFRRALDLAPEDEGAEGLQALVGSFTGELRRQVEEQLDVVPGPKTLELARDVELLAPREADSHALVGAVQQALGRFEQALDAYEAALALDEGHLRASWESGRILYEEKQWKDAAERLARFLELVKEAPDGALLEETAKAAADMIEQCRRRM